PLATSLVYRDGFRKGPDAGDGRRDCLVPANLRVYPCRPCIARFDVDRNHVSRDGQAEGAANTREDRRRRGRLYPRTVRGAAHSRSHGSCRAGRRQCHRKGSPTRASSRTESRWRSLMDVANTLPNRALAHAVNSRITADAVMLGAKSTLWRLTGVGAM